MKRIYIIIGVALLLFASCGRQQTAKSIVKDFMEANIGDYSKVSYLEFCELSASGFFSEMLKQVGLKSPFEDGCLEEIVKGIEEKL